MNDCPRMRSALMDNPEVGFGNVWKVGCDIERELNGANLQIKALEDALIPLVKMPKNKGKTVKRYKVEILTVSGPVRGFYIRTPEGKMIRDIYPCSISKELNKLKDHIKRLEGAGDYLGSLLLSGDGDNLTAKQIWNKAKESK